MRERVCSIVEGSKAPGRNPLLGPLAERLRDRQIELTMWDPTCAISIPPVAPDADLYLLKADHPAALSAAACLADAGAACLNDFASTEAAHDKGRMLARLHRSGLPVPASCLVGDRQALGELLDAKPRFVKPLRGAHGIGSGKLGPGEALKAGAGPWLVQEVVGACGVVIKAYGVGHRVAFRRMGFIPGAVDGPRERLDDADPVLTELAMRAAEVAGLVCFGADFVPTERGEVLVDLNAFPGYRSVPEAADWVTGAVVDALKGRR